jgi:hypothetical protein
LGIEAEERLLSSGDDWGEQVGRGLNGDGVGLHVAVEDGGLGCVLVDGDAGVVVARGEGDAGDADGDGVVAGGEVRGPLEVGGEDDGGWLADDFSGEGDAEALDGLAGVDVEVDAGWLAVDPSAGGSVVGAEEFDGGDDGLAVSDADLGSQCGKGLVGVEGFGSEEVSGEVGLVGLDDLVGGSIELDGPLVEPDGPVAEGFGLVWKVADEEEGGAALFEALDFLEAFPLEVSVANGEGLINDEDIGLGVDGDAKTEAQKHAEAIGADREVKCAGFEFGEGLNLGLDAVHLSGGDAKDVALETDVFAACEVRVEPAHEVNDSAHGGGDAKGAGGGLKGAGDQSEECGLSAAVGAQEGNRFAGSDGK